MVGFSTVRSHGAIIASDSFESYTPGLTLNGQNGGTGSATYNGVDLLVNPTSLSEATPTLTATNPAGTGVATFDNFVVRTARTDAGSQYNFDNLTIGTTFADVVPTPEPASMLVLLPLAGLLMRARRRVS